MSLETLGYEVEEGVAVITLRRPESHNAVNHQMSLELPLAWARFAEDEEARVAILTGSGERAFCSGADLRDPPATDAEGAHATRDSIRWTALQNQVWKPVICAVNGMVVGGGLHFVAESDLVVAVEQARFLDTHVRVGLVAGLEPVVLARRMPLEAVMRLALTGGEERLSAREAQALGLVGEVVSADRLMPRARELARSVAKHSPAALARTKRAIWTSKELGLGAALDHAWEEIRAHMHHPDSMEGGRAFVEGRPPRWQPFTLNAASGDGEEGA